MSYFWVLCFNRIPSHTLKIKSLCEIAEIKILFLFQKTKNRIWKDLKQRLMVMKLKLSMKKMSMMVSMLAKSVT